MGHVNKSNRASQSKELKCFYHHCTFCMHNIFCFTCFCLVFFFHLCRQGYRFVCRTPKSWLSSIVLLACICLCIWRYFETVYDLHFSRFALLPTTFPSFLPHFFFLSLSLSVTLNSDSNGWIWINHNHVQHTINQRCKRRGWRNML